MLYEDNEYLPVGYSMKHAEADHPPECRSCSYDDMDLMIDNYGNPLR